MFLHYFLLNLKLHIHFHRESYQKDIFQHIMKYLESSNQLHNQMHIYSSLFMKLIPTMSIIYIVFQILLTHIHLYMERKEAFLYYYCYFILHTQHHINYNYCTLIRSLVSICMRFTYHLAVHS